MQTSLSPVPDAKHWMFWRGLNRTTRIVCHPRLKPLYHLERLTQEEADEARQYVWRSTGNDPQFAWKRHLPVPGWNMLEVTIRHDQPSGAARLYVDTGRGFNEAESFYLTLKPGRTAKRLCYIGAGVRAIRFDPLETEGCFAVEHLRLVWLSPWFAYDRLAQRLANLHGQWLETPKTDILPQLKQHAREQNVHWRALALRQYEETFVRLCPRKSYRQWLVQQPMLSADRIAHQLAAFSYRPLISILLPTYDPAPEDLERCIESVLAQRYPHWQLCIADDASTDSRVRETLSRYAERDSRIEVVFRPTNGHICAASNSALARARGEYVALLDHDDRLVPEALYHVVEALQEQPQAELLYSDEDKVDGFGERYDPHFKPAWNPDLLLGQNYISHLGVYRTSRVRAIGGFRQGFEGSQDHDLTLRFCTGLAVDRIVRIPRVLYHWHAGQGSTAAAAVEKRYTAGAGLRAVQDHLDRHTAGARAEPGKYPNTYRIRWPLPDPAPLVSLLIPTRDQVSILRPCVEALLERTRYSRLEVLILDNGSTCRETLAFLGEIARDARVRVLQWPYPFNYSAINNFGVRHARGDILGLINNDIEPINEEWLEEMVSQACREEIGCVGAKLYYPDGTVQHGGVLLGVGGVAGHAHKYFSRHEPGYFSRLHLAQNFSAVTAACLVVRKSLFDAVGGLDEENLAVAFNDVDFCLKVREAGYRNLWTPFAELYHHESVSRGADDTSTKRLRATREADYMRRRWHHRLFDDPAYHPSLTLTYEDFSLR
ncbi:glycosyltransferase family 2 protein [Salinicola sp. LHM]|uniref:glycosyltransferase family 2 protein n=1 Tax=Salinicola sp. LHM TaxID=3065298 RepID=UPI002ACEAAED|nr:glycosyltransferase family 2 protein [Salinicola sp. LHM]WQH31652.1 glycosyltransferase family 2 protein [Salinicola sp. LHM]